MKEASNGFVDWLSGERGLGVWPNDSVELRGSTCPAWSEALCSIAESAWVQEPTKRPTAETLWGRLWNQLEVSARQREPSESIAESFTIALKSSVLLLLQSCTSL
eukprot:4326339-Amphidinium_carterae.1